MMRADTDTDTPAIDPEQSSPAFTGGVDGCDGHHITGWAASAVPGAPRLVVELLIDGEPCGQIGADLFRSDLAAMHIGDGHHAFALPLPASAFDGQAHQYAVREAESGVLLSGSPLTLTLARALANELPSEDIETGLPIIEADDVIADTAVSSSAISRPAPRRKAILTGRVDSCDGLGAHGWAAFADGRKAPAEVEWLLDGGIVRQISARLLRGDLAASGIGDGRHGFRITLPDSAYDGAMHALEVRSVIDGEPLAGSPLLFRMNPCHLWQRTDDLDEATRRRLADQALVYLEDLPADELQAGLLPQIRQLLTWLQTLPPGRLLKRAEAQRQRVAGSRYRAVICDAGRPDELRVQLTDHWGGDNALGIDLHEGDVLVASQAPLALAREPGHLLTLSFDLPTPLLDGRVHSFTLRLQPDGHALGPLHQLLNAASDPIQSSAARDPIWADTPGAKLARAGSSATPTPLTPVQTAKLRLDDADFDDDKPEAAQARRIDLILELAAAHLHAGDWPGALAQADQALALDPLHLDALCTGVRCLMAAGDDAGAAVRLAAALQACPDAPALHALGDALQGRSRTHRVRTLAFYLPQFHPTPDNNAWWGEGFTEWHNVGGATPLFSGHLQPRRPTTLGYYDLRLPEAVNAQFDLARRYGIDGFCYYYYWFEGRRILERPLDDLVAGRTGPFPFCICWANEDWTRAWDGATGEVLAAQNHAPDSDFAFIQDLAPLLHHPDYIRVDGKPMVLVYRADKLATPLPR